MHHYDRTAVGGFFMKRFITLANVSVLLLSVIHFFYYDIVRVTMPEKLSRGLLTVTGRGILVIAAALAIGCRGADLLGTYQTISESEWNVTVELKHDNIAIITLENWFPGEYDSRNIETTAGTWAKHDDLVLLKYNQIVDTLVFDPDLSLEELGREGGAPGLEQRTSFAPNSLVHDNKLWRMPLDLD
jgi:hypothetical protein